MKRIIGILLLLPLAYVVALYAASEWGGEVVEIETSDARGARFTTSVWLVDGYGDLWLRAGNAEAGWLARLRVTPELVLLRNGKRTRYSAEVVPDFSRRINELMRRKYGLADRIISTIHDPAAVVAIRLEES